MRASMRPTATTAARRRTGRRWRRHWRRRRSELCTQQVGRAAGGWAVCLPAALRWRCERRGGGRAPGASFLHRRRAAMPGHCRRCGAACSRPAFCDAAQQHRRRRRHRRWRRRPRGAPQQPAWRGRGPRPRQWGAHRSEPAPGAAGHHRRGGAAAHARPGREGGGEEGGMLWCQHAVAWLVDAAPLALPASFSFCCCQSFFQWLDPPV
jgi:hypothetical protein